MRTGHTYDPHVWINVHPGKWMYLFNIQNCSIVRSWAKNGLWLDYHLIFTDCLSYHVALGKMLALK